MAAVFFAWELGQGLRHLVQLKPLMQHLAARGHRLTLVCGTLDNVHRVLADVEVVVLQAPRSIRHLSASERHTPSVGQLLHNIGFHDADELATRVRAWRHLMCLCGADLLVADHSPTALLAARGQNVRTVVFGNGFTHPPPGRPFGPIFAPADAAAREALLAVDQRLVEVANRALAATGGPPLTDIGQLYADVDAVYLYSDPAFDHFGPREGVTYCGPVTDTADTETPRWPRDDAPKIYAYLKYKPQLGAALAACADARLNILIYTNDVPADLIARFRRSTLKFCARPLNLDLVAEQADLGIVNTNLGTTQQLLYGGLPLLLIPAQAEQLVLTARLVPTGAVVPAELTNPQALLATIERMLSDPRYAAAAATFAQQNTPNWHAIQNDIYTAIAARLANKGDGGTEY